MKDVTHERILKAATALFAERGFHGVSPNAIAEAAGVNEATIYRHFGHKEGVFDAVLDLAEVEFLSPQDAYVLLRARPLRTALIGYARALLAATTAQHLRLWLSGSLMGRYTSTVRVGPMRPLIRLVRDRIAGELEAGRLALEDVPAAERHFHALLFQVAMHVAFQSDEPLSTRAVNTRLAAAVDFWLDAVQPTTRRKSK